ncbi:MULTISPECIES: hypothetical protein [Serratia]|uniref:hypothetical protein n=1 Tax=Serratia TaxID=613 RepID=UPI0007451114|nr:hypothetical protein [Serratia marcescens]ELH4243974.1 hypothetical protein [Serratia marcescens]MBH3284755.1 hypothetical protein [Serratia marcescens]CAI0895872.1 Uncharacterised protein [Serratia marcescens]CAI1660782.1 Uncharacterised protein [Serratia marcescens]CVE01796.1 Uncharacterised protein [Serratia marcescens]
MKNIITFLIVSIVSVGVHADTLTEQEEQDAKDFAQALIQSKGYDCDKVTGFSNSNFSGRVDIFCDDYHHYKITKPGGHWKVEAK